MMLIDNRNYLRLHHRTLMEKLVQWEVEREQNKDVQVEPSRKDVPTLKMNVDGKVYYIHSKYDPQTEAERLISGLEDLDMYNHILLIGVGFGYHLQELLKKYPNMKFSIYEPNIEVLYQFLSYYNISEHLDRNLQCIFTGTEENDIRQALQLTQQINLITFIYTLPVYKNIYSEQERTLMRAMKDILKDKQSSLITNVSFQKRWTINSIKNFPTVLKTPNILYNVDREIFEGKPAIIVAAGPSLQEEYENLKHIKENELAYIFSVGSAINALIEHGIYPDAACTYDPTEKNQFVIQKIKDRNISEIPLIFGSSVGFETIADYPGKLLHMITSQDTISPRLLDTSQNIDIVFDAPSIAVVTFQLLSQLGCNPIILAGQNLGYQNNERYAAGIQYDFINNTLTKEEQRNLLTVKDVYGNDIGTNDGFNRMRQQLEMYICSSANIEVLNTTKGGAHIEGATFLTLEEVISNKLTEKNVVEKEWYNSKNSYDIDIVVQKTNVLNNELKRCEQQINDALHQLKVIETTLQKRQLNQLEVKFNAFDKAFNKVKNNLFYEAFIAPMIRVQNEKLSDDSKVIRYETNLDKKGKKIVVSFGKFLLECQANYHFVLPYYEELDEKITNYNTAKKSGKKMEEL